jgi:hypothetical protein
MARLPVLFTTDEYRAGGSSSAEEKLNTNCLKFGGQLTFFWVSADRHL